MSTLSRFEMVRAAMRQGVPRHLAEKLAGDDVIPTVTLPLTLTLPWSCLVSDNERSTIGGGSQPRLVNGARYRAAKRRIAEIAREVVGDVRPVTGPVALHARIYIPDNRVHDTGNFRKICTDALQSIVFANDKQVYDDRWTRAGIDCDAPRAEITVRYL